MWSKQALMWLQLLLCNIIVVINAAEVGEECVPNNDISEGVCTEITNCLEAIRSIRKQNYHQFQRCGFDGDQEVVCCPNTSSKFGLTEPPNRSLTERVSDRECQKIVARHIQPLGLYIIGGEMASTGEFPHMLDFNTSKGLTGRLAIANGVYAERHFYPSSVTFPQSPFTNTHGTGGSILCLNYDRIQVAIGFDRGNGYEFDCGGSLISSDYVLTAAHCIDTLDRIEPSIVRVGVVELGGNTWSDDTDVRISRIITYPTYTRREKYHDLALLRLEKPVEFNSGVNAACLYTSPKDPSIPLTITGWGQTSTETEKRSNVLLKANVTVVSRDECGKSYATYRKLPRGVSAEQLCAGDPDGLRDTCQGDSGGPLQGVTASDGQYRLVGVTSFGRGCGSPVPGVYTRIQHYLDWIEGVVWPNS